MNRGSLHTLRHSRGWCSRIDLWNINVTNSIIDCLRPHRNYAHQETPPRTTYSTSSLVRYFTLRGHHLADMIIIMMTPDVPCRVHECTPLGHPRPLRGPAGVFSLPQPPTCGVDKPPMYLVLWPLPRKYTSQGVKLNFLKSWGQVYLQYPSSDRCTQLRTGVRLNDVVLNHIDNSFCLVPWFMSLLFPEHYEISYQFRQSSISMTYFWSRSLNYVRT